MERVWGQPLLSVARTLLYHIASGTRFGPLVFPFWAPLRTDELRGGAIFANGPFCYSDSGAPVARLRLFCCFWIALIPMRRQTVSGYEPTIPRPGSCTSALSRWWRASGTYISGFRKIRPRLLRLKCERERAMARILFRCPKSRTVIPTGLTTEAIKFESLSGVTMPVECPICRRIHMWECKQAWVETEEQDE